MGIIGTPTSVTSCLSYHQPNKNCLSFTNISVYTIVIINIYKYIYIYDVPTFSYYTLIYISISNHAGCVASAYFTGCSVEVCKYLVILLLIGEENLTKHNTKYSATMYALCVTFIFKIIFKHDNFNKLYSTNTTNFTKASLNN